MVVILAVFCFVLFNLVFRLIIDMRQEAEKKRLEQIEKEKIKETKEDKIKAFGKAVSLSGRFVRLKTGESGHIRVEQVSLTTIRPKPARFVAQFPWPN